MRSLLDRFMEKVCPEALTGCWLWTAAVDAKGYGRIFNGLTPAGNKRPVIATHVAWDLFVGTDRAGLNVLHRCDTPSCVAPHHLFLGSKKDNTTDMMTKGRGKFRPDLKDRDRCKNGHEFTDENTSIRRDGSRNCKTCGALRTRAHRARRENQPQEPKP